MQEFGQERHRGHVVSSEHHTRRRVTWIRPIGDADCDHLLYVVSASIHCCEAPVFLFLNNEYLVRGYFGTM